MLSTLRFRAHCLMSATLSTMLMTALLVYSVSPCGRRRPRKVLPLAQQQLVDSHRRRRPSALSGFLGLRSASPTVKLERGSSPASDSDTDAQASSSTLTPLLLTRRDRQEKVRRSVKYYAQFWGYEYEERRVTTDDGFVLLVDHIYRAGNNHSRPIVLMHGLMQGSGVFVTSGSNSLAFYLADRGYSVFLPNNRCVGSHGHTHYASSWRPEMWQWTLTSLAQYDVPAIVQDVKQACGTDQLVWVGHSQGNAQMFLALQMYPELSASISLFVALAPAVYIGQLFQQSAPLRAMCKLTERQYFTLFGPGSFVGIMHYVQRYAPPSVFTALAYHMFAYCFDWSDTNWDRRHKNKYFQFTPRDVSTASLLEWLRNGQLGYIRLWHASQSEHTVMAGSVPVSKVEPPNHGQDSVASASQTVDATARRSPSPATFVSRRSIDSSRSSSTTTTLSSTCPPQASASRRPTTPPAHVHRHDSLFSSSAAHPADFDLSQVSAPVMLFAGGLDFLVSSDPIRQSIKDRHTHIKLRADVVIDHYEHMDFIWATDAQALVWDKIVAVLDDPQRQ
ncbi:hypothetical protein RI367_007802 [Sorochytrium milnesiophthora]